MIQANMNIERANTDVCLLTPPINSQFHGCYAFSTRRLVGGGGGMGLTEFLVYARSPLLETFTPLPAENMCFLFPISYLTRNGYLQNSNGFCLYKHSRNALNSAILMGNEIHFPLETMPNCRPERTKHTQKWSKPL